MKEESIEIAIDTVISALCEADIEMVDKMELMLNMRQFLLNYNTDIQVLRKVR